jgi:hypothetical protein
LTERAEAAGIEVLALSPRMGDFNEDLRAFGLDALQAALRIQIEPTDVVWSMLFAEARAGRPIGLRRRRQLGRLYRVVCYVADRSRY